jgi:hydrogenase/urease accessory protein HupE
MIFRRLLALVLLLMTSLSVSAHEVSTVEFEFQPGEKQWVLEGQMDIAYMLPETRHQPGGLPLSRTAVMKSTPEEFARIRMETEKILRTMLTLKYNGETLPWRIEFPDFQRGTVDLPEESNDWALLTTRITMDARPGPGELRAYWSMDEKAELIVTTGGGGKADDLQLLSAVGGSDMLLLSLGTPPERFPILGWIRMGFDHVIQGYDHILFVIGLFLLVPRWKPLMGQSLLFTLSHSITLSLAALGLISLQSRTVETLIAASIAWVGIENMFAHKLGKQRMILVFLFGLLHGMGFASVLQNKLGAVPREKIVMPILGFNIGVELAQITVLAAAFILLLPLRRWTHRVRIYGSVVVAATGLYWMITRIFA